VLLLPLVSAPTLVVLAGAIERRHGSSAAGWLAAIPTTLPIGILAVAAELGDRASAAMALSAAAHVGAQVGFAVTFALTLLRRGVLCGLAVGATTFSLLSLLLGQLPSSLAIALALPALAAGPRLLRDVAPRAGVGAARRAADTLLASVVAVALVASVLVTARLAGPVAAGAIGAFPALSAALTLVAARGTDRLAAAATLRGVIRGLPCYLAFCLVVAFTAPLVGTPAAALLAGAVCLATCALTWRTVQVA
jgi:hypothetical protein